METLIILCSSIVSGLLAGTSFYIGYKTGFDSGRKYGRDEQFKDRQDRDGMGERQ